MTAQGTDTQSPDNTPVADLQVTLPVAEPAGAGDETTALLRELCERIGRLDARFEDLDAKFEDKVREDKAREAIVERLHGELQKYKSDLLLQMLKPVLLDMISLYDNIGKALDAANGEEGELGYQLRRRLGEFRTEVEDVLSKQGVELYVVPDDAFDPRRQQPVETRPAPSPDQEGKVAVRLRPGFTREGRVLRPERVVVFIKPPAQP
jgi:molecular chaperone GrpE